MSVKRYDLVGDMDGNCNLNEARMELSDDGVYVKYSEHLLLEQKLTDMAVQLANAESKCRDLAAENVTLNDKMNRLATWPGIEFYSSAWEFCNLDGNDALEFMCDVKTPATDAFLAEVRTQGVEMYADTLDRAADDAERNGFDDGMRFLRAESEGVRKFAAQLRKGVQS